jgi:hypothetical protein
VYSENVGTAVEENILSLTNCEHLSNKRNQFIGFYHGG